MVLRGKEQVETRRFSGNKLIRAVMNHCKRKGKDTIIYIVYSIYLGARCVRAGVELVEEGSAWG